MRVAVCSASRGVRPEAASNSNSSCRLGPKDTPVDNPASVPARNNTPARCMSPTSCCRRASDAFACAVKTGSSVSRESGEHGESARLRRGVGIRLRDDQGRRVPDTVIDKRIEEFRGLVGIAGVEETFGCWPREAARTFHDGERAIREQSLALGSPFVFARRTRQQNIDQVFLAELAGDGGFGGRHGFGNVSGERDADTAGFIGDAEIRVAGEAAVDLDELGSTGGEELDGEASFGFGAYEHGSGERRAGAGIDHPGGGRCARHSGTDASACIRREGDRCTCRALR